MHNHFELKFDKMITKLAGNPLGKQVFKEQLMGNVNYEYNITIVIPDRIDTIASSFIQGFFEDIVKNIGISGIEDRVSIISSIPDIKNLIIRNLL
ncbi:hypothetical protein QVE09_25075 [Paenibacillus sp. ClWae2A]|uniref:hypothetical protein n=1 Tax=Paenibacillus sp. ClWae2A TaxID=3057177 RepID=UPI0028F62D74|nr:hypothetical protein [Paenibacillus sp. ClWae2A]MDT9722186.1 hypothetical protein [Paenibacillus sp. ClWae2A]